MHGFLRTSLTISWHFLIKLGPVRGGKMIAQSVWLVIKARLFHRPSLLSDRRTFACKKCQMFDHKFGTCGEVGIVYQDKHFVTHPLGCWCICRLSNRLPRKDCWAKHHGLDFGWDESIRPFKV